MVSMLLSWYQCKSISVTVTVSWRHSHSTSVTTLEQLWCYNVSVRALVWQYMCHGIIVASSLSQHQCKRVNVTVSRVIASLSQSHHHDIISVRAFVLHCLEYVIMVSRSWVTALVSYHHNICVTTSESLFDWTMPLEHIDFHIISYWTSNIWLLWHISLEETCCLHIGYSFW